MAVQVWPASLPQRFPVDGYSETLPDGRLHSRMETGPGRVRRRFSSAVMPVRTTLILTFAQKGTLESFWRYDLGDGTLPFKIPDQTHHEFELLDNDGQPFTDNSGTPFIDSRWWFARFGEAPPAFSPIGGDYFNAVLDIEVLP